MALRPGVALKIGGVEYTAPKLNLTGVMAIEESDALKMRTSDSLRTKIDGCMIVLVASLVRNYPDMTVDRVRAELEGDEIQPMILAVGEIIVQSGFVPRDGAPGEAKAGDRSTLNA